MLDGVEIRRVGRQVEKGVTGLFEGFLHLDTFVEAGIVHNHNALRRQFWNQILLHPAIKNEGIDGVENNETVSKTLPIRAPMAFILPLAPQS